MSTVFVTYVGLGLLLFAPVMGAFFVSDDFVYLTAVAQPAWPDVMLWQPGVFRPLHAFVGLLDYQLWGLNPVGYHLTNIVSHCVTAFLVFVVARQLVRSVLSETDANWASVVAGLVFLVHPSHTEAVSWIIGRHDIFAALFLLLSLLAYVAPESRWSPLLLAASMFAFFIALLFKESVITFPLVLVAYEASRRGNIRIKLPLAFVAIVGVYVLVRRVAAGELVAGYEAAFIHPNWSMLPNLAATLFRSFLPYAPLELLPRAPRVGLTGVAGIVAGVVIAGLGLLLLRRVRTSRTLLAFLFAALIISMLPTLAFAPSIIDSESERYAYLPSVFASMLCGLTVTSLARTRIARMSGVAAVLLFLGSFLELSNQNWRTAGALSREILSTLQAEHVDAVLVVPDSLNGAFIYRNGLPEALNLFGPGQDVRIPVFTSVFLKRSDETVELDRLDAASFSVSLPAERGALRVEPGVTDSALTASGVGLYRADFTVHRLLHVAYFSGGLMQFADLNAEPAP